MLFISNDPGLSQAAYEGIYEMKSLEYLDCAGSRCDDRLFTLGISPLKKLNGLTIDGLGDIGMQAMPKLAKLKTLDLRGGPGVSDKGIARLGSMRI